MTRVICTEFISDPYESREGFASFYLPKMRLNINHCAVFLRNGKRWMSVDTWKDFKNSGKYFPILEFDEPFHTEFLKLALNALNIFLNNGVSPSVFDAEFDTVPQKNK